MPLIRQMDRFAQLLTGIILAACAAVFAFAVYVRDYPWPDAFMVVIGSPSPPFPRACLRS